MVKAAASNKSSGKEIMAFLLEQRGNEVQITEEVVRTAAGNWYSGKEIMMLLLERQADTIMDVNAVFREIVTSLDAQVVRAMLSQCGHKIRVTEEVVKAAANENGNGETIIKVLFEHGPQETTACLSSSDGFEWLTPRLIRVRIQGEWCYLRSEHLDAHAVGFS